MPDSGTAAARGISARSTRHARRPLSESVIVVTGASGGIGRAAAEAFAAQGAAVVLAARREAALDTLRAECVARGGEALAVPTDVTDAEAVSALVQRTLEAYGRIDVWVNNAAVTAFGRFEDVPVATFERVIQTNLMGYAYAAHAVLPVMRRQGSGVLINVGSVVSGIGMPFTSAYVASKWAIRGLSECLRAELQDAPGVHVCTVMPASTDTPLFQQAANYTGRAPRAMTPVASAERVAAAIVGAAQRRRREVIVGLSGRLAMAGYAIAPRLFSRLIARAVEDRHFQDKAAPPGDGNLFEASGAPGRIGGGWQEYHRRLAGRREPRAPLLQAAASTFFGRMRRRRRLLGGAE